jgi:hypothetical protein
LNIKYSQKKQEMREDPVLEFFFKTKDFVLKNVNILIGAAVVVTLSIGVVFIYSLIQRSSGEKAEEAFGKALIDYNNRTLEKAIEGFRVVAENHHGTSQGIISAHMLGGIFFSMGRYDEAIQWFEMAANAKGELGFVGAETQEGLAGCFEAKGKLPQALEHLEKALRDDRIRYRHAAIRWKMALVNQKLNDAVRAKALCREILSDTAATEYRQRAENLLAVLEATSG